MFSLRIRNIYGKKKGIAKKLILTLRAILISQEVDVVASDFNGTAWRHRGQDNLSTIDEAFMDIILPTPPGPTSLETGFHSVQMGRLLRISQTSWVLTVFGKCILHATESTWFETKGSKLPS